MTVLIVGATAGIGRALGRSFVRRGRDVILLARDARDLEAEAAYWQVIGLAVRHAPWTIFKRPNF